MREREAKRKKDCSNRISRQVGKFQGSVGMDGAPSQRNKEEERIEAVLERFVAEAI